VKEERTGSAEATTAGTASGAVDVPRLARIILQVGDTAEAIRFYAELLGVPGRPVGGGRVYFDCGPVILALLDPSAGGTAPAPLPDIVYLTVRDVKPVFARAEKLGCLDPQQVHGEPAGAIVERPWGELSFYAVDRWGNGLCFIAEKTLFTGARPPRR
jgi:hypothetical protein